MCAEHGVLESVCTKCNPALAAVFRARGDWCEEHGLPESFCPICHPDRGGRPAGDVSAGTDGPADGTKVRFRSMDTARIAGLRIVQALERSTSREVLATGRVVYDATRVAQINARMAGVIRALRADVGARIEAGAALAVLDSASLGAEQSRLQTAHARFAAADSTFARLGSLRAEGISSERDLLAARRERDEALADVRGARASLRMVGTVTPGRAQYTLTTPLAGVVTQRMATIGTLVDEDDVLFEVVDPSQMWIELDVPEMELGLVAPGQSVTMVLDGVVGREFTASLSYVAPAIDTRTRTSVARAPLPNPDGVLRANMFGRGRIAVTDPRAAVLVPDQAVQRARDVHLVFVRLAEDLYEARRVAVGPRQGELVSVSGRIRAGEDVVAEGSFLLKTETLKESIGAGCCEVEPN